MIERLRMRAFAVAQLASLAAIAPASGQTPDRHAGNRTGAEETAVFAGGCYWGVESVFEHIRGVRDVIAGFAAPAVSSPGASRPTDVEAVRLVFDPSRISYQQLLQVFFLVAHDPTEVGRQGPDIGPEYRSVVFVAGDAQHRLAQGYLAELTTRRTFARPIATEIALARSFRPAPDQDYVARNPTSPYVVAYDLPKLAELRRRFPELYRP